MIDFKSSVRTAAMTSLAVVCGVALISALLRGEPSQASNETALPVGMKNVPMNVDDRMTRLLEKLERRKVAVSLDAFAVPDWNQPLPTGRLVQDPISAPPAIPEIVVVPKPEAPPLPFVYIGHMSIGGSLEVFLGAGPDGVRIKAGDTVRDAYRVEEITQQSVTFTHLPTGLRQELPIPVQ